MDVLRAAASAEIMVKNSRFLAELLPCQEQAAARELIAAQKKKYADPHGAHGAASHVVHAFILGLSAEVCGMSDDGEPSGTAGRPVLDVLRGRGCTNTLLTVTRWFGGTLLGTGGLVRAYGDAAKAVIAAADTAGAFAPYVAKKSFSVAADYALYERLTQVMKQFSMYDITEAFGTGVTVSGYIRADEFKLFADMVRTLSAGKTEVRE